MIAAAVAGAAGPSVAGAAGPSVVSALDVVARPGLLRNPPDRFRPIVRWWWPTDALDPAEIRRELRAMRAAGFRGVEQVLLANPLQFGSPNYRSRTKLAVQEARRLGLRYDLTLGPAWPMSSPGVSDLSKATSMQDLHYGSVDLLGPVAYDGEVPDEPPPGGRIRRLVATVGMRVVRDGFPQVLQPESAVVLPAPGPDGHVRWAVPPGRWKLFGFWMRPSLLRSAAPAGGGRGWLVADHFNRRATAAALADFDRMLLGGDMAPLLRGGDVFEDSYEIRHGLTAPGHGAVFWTADMAREFAKRRGYPLTRLLPGLFPEFSFEGGTDWRLERDFDTTVNDLLIDEHLKVVTRWARRRGLRSRVQAYQAGVGDLGRSDNSRLAAAADKPDVESLGFGDPMFGQTQMIPAGSREARGVLNRYRQVVSGAHLSGATEVTLEWGAVMNGELQTRPEDLKVLADRAMAAGVSRMALHGFAYRLSDQRAGPGEPRPNWPGWCAWCGSLGFADSWNQAWPQWRAWPRFTEYLGRAGAVLRSGRPRVDLTLLSAKSSVAGFGGATTTSDGEDAVRRALERAGYTWDVLSPNSVPRSASTRRRALFPSGPGYRALVVDDQVAVPGEAAKRLVALARAGLPVVVYGQAPRGGTSYRAPEREDKQVRAAVRRLRALPDVRFARTPGALVRALRGLRVRPDLRPPRATTVVGVHRRTAAGDAWFLYNDSVRPVRTRLEFAARGAPRFIDLWTGAVSAADVAGRSRTTTSVVIALRPQETAAIVFSPGARNTGRSLRRAGSALTVRGPWRVNATTISPAGRARISIRLRRPLDWSAMPQLQGRSGTAAYTARVRVPDRWLARGRLVLLDPGRFGGALRAWINGRSAEVPTVTGERPRDIRPLLRPGDNRLQLEITTTLNNAARTQGLLGNSDFVKYAGRPLQPEGLLGPVRLLPYAERR